MGGVFSWAFMNVIDSGVGLLIGIAEMLLIEQNAIRGGLCMQEYVRTF